MYYYQVKAYLDNFRQTKIYFFEELKFQDSLLKDLYAFLEVRFTEEQKDYIKYNVSGYPRNKLVHNFLNKDNAIKKIMKPMVNNILPKGSIQKVVSYIQNKNLKKVSMKNDTRERLKNVFEDDIKKLSNLIKMDLSHWL